MEDDDEFGDLYTDIVLPTAEPPRPPPLAETPPRAAPAPNPNSAPAPASAAAAAGAEEDDDDDWLLGGGEPLAGVDPTTDWVDEDDDGGAAPAVKREVDAKPPPPAAEDPDPLMGVGADDPGAAIPGLSSSAAAGGAAGSEDWDSDSEDDLQIVLNETDGRRRLGEDEGDDEDGEDLLIVADGPHIPGMEEQEWVEDGTAAGPEGERKEGGEPGKTGPMPGGRIGYSGGGPGFNPQHHSMFKYVRPGAPTGGAPGAPGQFRPPGPQGPFSGRGRGDWRPGAGRGMNKGFHSGYGMTPWGGAGRGFGGGLDFTLPPHKIIFDIDIDTTFEEKPWKYSGAEISDFFNFGLDEEKWKDYCKQLDQSRLESTMQSRIRVYESGRSEQDYDPDLPPELAAAAGHHDISADNRNKVDNGHADFSAQGRVPTSNRPAVMMGRPIQVETGYGERFPSADTRPRMRDSDSVIEIVCEAPADDPIVADSSVDQSEKDSQGGKKSNGVEESEVYTPEKTNNSSYNSTLGKAEHTRRLPVSSEGDMLTSDVHGRSPPNYKIRGSPSRGVRLKGRSQGVNPSREAESSNEVPRKTTSSKRRRDTPRDSKPVDDSETKDGLKGSPTVADETTDKLSTEDQFADNDDRLALVDSAEADADDAISEPHMASDTNEGDHEDHSSKRQKIISKVEQPPRHNNSSDQVDLKTLNSENSRGVRSGSSKDNQKRLESGEEVLQDRRSRRVNDARRHHDGEERDPRRKDVSARDIKPEIERTHLASRGRDDIHHPYGNRDRDVRGKSFDRVRETEILQRREDSMHNRRGKEEDLRLNYNAEVGARQRNKLRPIDRNDRDEDPHPRKLLDDGDWRGSRQRERGDMVLNSRESLDDSHIKRKKDEENTRRMKPENEDAVHGYRGRDDPNRRKRERDDGIDQKRRDDGVRMREKADDRSFVKNKEDNLRQREKDDKQRPKHESTLLLQREEGRGTGRGGRVMDEKIVSGGRKKDESRSALLSKETQERSKHNEPGRRGQGAEENNTQNKGRADVRPRDDNPNNNERNSRQDKINKTHDNNRVSSSSDARQANRDKPRESTRKGRGSVPNEQDLHRSSKRRREDHESHRSGKVEVKGGREQENGRDHATSSKTSKNPQRHDSFVKQGEEEAMSDDENTDDSRRGRSKLERWTSHKEIDYSTIDNETTHAFPSIKADVQPPTADASGKSDVPAIVVSSDMKNSGDNGQASEMTAEERDRHLDTVERLKRRSERFKLPMPGEKEVPQNKKVDAEVQTPHNESPAADVEVKPERPARKRRWAGS
ncbi:FIP1[V]-like protein [Triticum dicoccoides]|uniref:FIP1[V]-like protein n=1 Tax=Triticum dicoccoides TaxID=85692 RepID=UPI00188FE522|nr:FIP1[V]-like protein [Triticum dicoccoides]